MADPVDLRCDNCKGDPSSLRLIVTETVWYLLDVTDDGLYPDQPEADPEWRLAFPLPGDLFATFAAAVA